MSDAIMESFRRQLCDLISDLEQEGYIIYATDGKLMIGDAKIATGEDDLFVCSVDL